MKTSMRKSRVENGAQAEKPTQFRVLSKNETAEASATGGKGISRVNLSGIAKTGESRKAEKYPALPDPDGAVASRVDQLIELQAQLDQTEGAIKLIKADLIATARPFYFTYCNGKGDVPSSVAALNGDGEALINFQNRYSGLQDDSQLVAILGTDTSRYFCETFEIKIDGAAIPQENAQPLINELSVLFERYNATGALKAKAAIKPRADFHEARHLLLDAQTNIAVDGICPCVVAVKTKGRQRE